MAITSGVSFNTPPRKSFRYPDISCPKAHWHGCAQWRKAAQICLRRISVYNNLKALDV